jgi:DegV family protein with EDD domain
MEYIRRNFISIVPLKLLFGDEVFLDKVEISPSEFLRKCRRSPHHPTTSQPSVQDYLKAYGEAGSRKPEILVVSLSGAISGTFQAAQTAASQYTDVPVHVFDSRTVTVAQGLLVQHARTLALAGEDAASIAAKLEEIKRRAKVFVSLRTHEFLRRGGRISSTRSLVATLLNLRPVISLSEEGKVISPAKAWGRFGVRRKVLQMARQEWERYKDFRVAVAHVDAPGEADYYVSRIEKLTGLKDVPVVEVTAVLGAHVGPGAAGIGVLGLE